MSASPSTQALPFDEAVATDGTPRPHPTTVHPALPFDEAFSDDGTPRPHYAALSEALDGVGLAALAAGVQDELRARGVALAADPLPRIFTAEEWAPVAAGLEQRVRALAAFAADAHGPQRAVAAGVVPPDLIAGSKFFEPDLAGTPGAPSTLGMAGPDLVRLPSGELVVLEDNVRTPSLKAFAALAAEVVDRHVPAPLRHHDFAAALVAALRGIVRPERDAAIVLSEGGSRAEGAWLARATGLPHAGPADLAHAGDRLVLREGQRPVDLVLRHTPEERLRTDSGGPTWLADALLRPLQAGTLTVVNPFGAGVADDKRTYAFADALVRFFCGEDPLLRSVPTLDLGVPSALDEALDRLGELVFKPRSGSGGREIVVGPRARAADLARLRSRVLAEPSAWIAQETLAISTHPVVDPDGALTPRHVDLRAFVIGGRALPGGLTRYAPAEGELVVNGTRGGGGKATRVLV